MLLKNKGAMFGLDARIALAIFGALSVISGAALYSAIQQAKVAAIVTELEEFAKAYQSYMIDVGQEMEFSGSTDIGLKTLELITSSKSGWKGPYIPYSTSDMVTASTHSLKIDKYESLFIIKSVSDNTFGDYTGGASQTTCVGNNTVCSIWVGVTDVGRLETAKAIDVMVDGTESANSGRLRVRNHSTTKYAVYYEVMPSLSTD
ncbi:MAG TPA: hypothetical protein DCL21_04475 [Alphaproteobacteria bacterium]|nr:hypothetical protein [Alphaproteobacteria bacterium]